MPTLDYPRNVERPADHPTWRLGTDHVVVLIPDDVARMLLPDGHPDLDPRLVASVAADAITPPVFLRWWFRDSDPVAYGRRYTATMQPDAAHLYALGELERMLDWYSTTHPMEPVPIISRSLLGIHEDEREAPHRILVIRWFDVLAYIWTQLVEPVTWRDARASAPYIRRGPPDF